MYAASTVSGLQTLAKSFIKNDEPTFVDSLGRDTQLLGLSRIILTARPPFVVGVYGKWGEGKTSFLQILKQLLSKEGREKYKLAEVDRPRAHQVSLAARFEDVFGQEINVPSIWFNAWKYQFEDEPVLPLLDEIRRQVPQTSWARVKGSIRKAIEDPRLRIVGKAALGVGKLVGPGWLSALEPKGWFSLANEKMAGEVFRDFGQFQSELNDSLKLILQPQPGDVGAPPDRMVIFVDDLDRCEPPYVVKMLESLKLHLLNEHCVFVLGCAVEHISQSLVSMKLAADDAEAARYLEKIVQLPLQLPPIWEQTLSSYLYDELGGELLAHDPNVLEECFKLLQVYSDGNPRRLKRFLAWFALQKSMIDMVEGLREEKKGKSLLEASAVLLKVKLLQFAEPALYVQPSDFSRDVPEQKEPSASHKLAFKAMPPFVGEWLKDESRLNQLLLVLALTTDENIAHSRMGELHANRKVIQAIVGTWRGFYIQNEKRTEFVMKVNSFDGLRFEGTTEESGPSSLGPASIRGKYELGSGTVSFDKRYNDKAYVIEYVGIVERRNAVEGTWKTGRESDRFWMQKDDV